MQIESLNPTIGYYPYELTGWLFFLKNFVGVGDLSLLGTNLS